MTTAALGEDLLSLCSTSREVIVLIAPFVKTAAIKRLLNASRPEVPVHCITRWRPEEIAAGVSDLDVWRVLEARGNATLGLVANLHAKYYRGDRTCLVGSANVTATALGWIPGANIELLVKLDASFGELLAFETTLRSHAVEVSHELYAEYDHLVRELSQIYSVTSTRIDTATNWEAVAAEEGLHSDETVGARWWVPSLRHPEQLYLAYSGGSQHLTSTARANAAHDLAELALPFGLDRQVFQLFVRWQLLQLPIVHALDHFLSEPRRFGAVRAWLGALPHLGGEGDDATDAWQRLMRWLLYFASDRYTARVANYSEIFSRQGSR
jgi:hypothetical protein